MKEKAILQVILVASYRSAKLAAVIPDPVQHHYLKTRRLWLPLVDQMEFIPIMAAAARALVAEISRRTRQ